MQLLSTVSFQMCSHTTRQNRFKFEMAIAFTFARRTFWSLSRSRGEESQLWMIRTQLGLWKRVPLKQKKFQVFVNWELVSIWWYQTANDDTIDKSNSPYLGSCWQQKLLKKIIGHRSYHCVPLPLTDWVNQSLLFQITPVFKSENNSPLDAMFISGISKSGGLHTWLLHSYL